MTTAGIKPLKHLIWNGTNLTNTWVNFLEFFRKCSWIINKFILGVRYPCTQCDYKSPLPHTLRHHIKTVHDGVKYPCELCDFKAASNINLRNHVKTVHEGIKYYCNICDFRTARVSRLNKHMKTEHNSPEWINK